MRTVTSPGNPSCICCFGCCSSWGSGDLNVQWFYQGTYNFSDPSGSREICNTISTMPYIPEGTGWYCQKTFPFGTLGFGLRCDNTYSQETWMNYTLYVQSGVYECPNGPGTYNSSCNCLSFGIAAGNTPLAVPDENNNCGNFTGSVWAGLNVTPWPIDHPSGCVSSMPCHDDLPNILTLTYTRVGCDIPPTGAAYTSGSGLTGTIQLSGYPLFGPGCGGIEWINTADTTVPIGGWVATQWGNSMGPYYGWGHPINLQFLPAPCNPDSSFWPCMGLNGPVIQTDTTSPVINTETLSCSPIFLEFDNCTFYCLEVGPSGYKSCTFKITITE